MGNRGIRLCLDRKRMFKAQLRAIYRASAYGNLAMMYPMIDSEEEMDQIEEIIREVKAGLDEKGIPYQRHPHRDHDRDTGGSYDQPRNLQGEWIS